MNKNLMKYNTAIILPLKESFSYKDFGAVSIWVNDYLNYSKIKSDIIFCKKLPSGYKYLKNNICPITISGKFYTNHKYIKNIAEQLSKKKINIVEIHNRPEYALYLIKNNPSLKVNLIFHNDPNTIRYSNKVEYKNFLLTNCNKIIFVSSWVKKKFFEGLDISHKNNTDIIYNFINPINKFPNKKKTIIFSGKLNKSKGFDIFGRAIVKILNKYPEWNAVVYGNEQREIFSFKHPRLKINNWINHKKLLKIFESCSISVVNPTWDEPFGRTALESASRGCAVITSNSGGLSETFTNNLILKKNNPKELVKLVSKLIDDKVFLRKIQLTNFKDLSHPPKDSVFKLDLLRKKNLDFRKEKKLFYKILHISNFGIKNDHRLFNLSIAKKLSNGLIRNGHDVIDFDYRNHNTRLFDGDSLDKKVISIIENYKPNLILFGHNNCLNRNSLNIIKDKYKSKIALWYEDHVIKGDPSYKKNLDLIEKNHDLIDHFFITTSPDIIKTKIHKSKLNYLPIPVDPNIEDGKYYKHTKTKDMFFGLSHGVNYGKLKRNSNDNRINFINDLIKTAENKINFNILGLYGEQPKWNYEFNKELMISKTALNLSRGGPNKYASSNRIASLMGNGVLPFVHQDVHFQDFFDNDEIVIYKNHKDLLNELLKIKSNKKNLQLRSAKSKKSYFNYFQNNIVGNFIIHTVFGSNKKYKYVWAK